jgi:branched-chain amino acid transport system ATP-binding protein
MKLDVINLNLTYGGVRAISDVSLKVPAGSIAVLIGANGAGKSSLIRSIIGLVRRDSGEIWLGGQRIDGLHPGKIASLGLSLVPEGRRVFREMTVLENLLMGAYLLKTKKETRDNVEEVCDLLPVLKERKNQIAGSLSGGEQQMLAIGRALMGHPNTVLLDEPSLGLAPIVVQNLAKFIVRLNRERGLTLLMAEQNVRVGLRIADYGYVLENGTLKVEGKGQDLLHNEYVLRAYLGGS